MIEVKKKDNESFESLFRRFSRKVMQSGVVIRGRKHRYFERPKSRTLKKKVALRREDSRKKRDEARRMGLIPLRGRR